ncbi:MAG: DUF4251 domain-containing protein [Bacteroidales bacterium]
MMKKNFQYVILMLISVLFCMNNLYAQQKTKKQQKEEKRIAQQMYVDSLVAAKEFVFIGRMALPQGTRSINLATRQNFVKFFPDSVSGDMPFFGKAYSVSTYGGDGGIIFSGKPEVYEFKTTKKNHVVKVKIKSNNDSYQLTLSISYNGSASLMINSVNRSSISYSGDIFEPEKKK